ncbi:MAG: YnbE family lipoprotein [Desulfobacula sp.]
MEKKMIIPAVFLILYVFSGCQSSHQVEIKPVEIKPIHITIDVNVRVEKALDSFFDDLEAAENKIKKE